MKTRLTENDLEMILNTKMITTNRAEELVKQQQPDYGDDEDYISVTSLFQRNKQPTMIENKFNSTNEIDQEEIKRRCQALSGVAKISSSLSPSNEKEGN